MKKLLLLLIAFISSITFTSAQWTKQVSNTNWGFSSVYFVNQDTGWAVGNSVYGDVYKTMDGGAQWSVVSNLFYTDPNTSVFFTSATKGFICDNGGVVNVTFDGGTSWSTETLTFNELFSMYFVNADTGFVAGGNDIFKTTDGGYNWTSVHHMSTDQNDVPEVYSISFCDANNGWAVGEGVDGWGFALYTNDGGDNWNNNSIGCFNNICNVGTQAVQCISADTIYVVGSCPTNSSAYHSYLSFFQTTNGGQTWSVTNLDSSIYNFTSLSSLFFLNGQEGYIGDVHGKIWKTVDGGKTLFQQASGVTTSLNSIFFLNHEVGYAVGDNGVILKTVNGGGTSASCSSTFSLSPDPNQLHHYIATSNSSGSSPVKYYWSWGDGTYDTIPYPSHTYADSGFYNVCLYVTDSLNCISSDCDNSFHAMRSTNSMVYIDVVPLGISKPGLRSSRVEIYPNPAGKSLTIKNAKPGIARIYDMFGQLCFSSDLNPQNEINVSNLSPGMYFLELQTENGNVVRKFVKE